MDEAEIAEQKYISVLVGSLDAPNQIADYKTFLIKKVQQDINNRRKRLGQNKVKILIKQSQKYIFLGQKKWS